MEFALFNTVLHLSFERVEGSITDIRSTSTFFILTVYRFGAVGILFSQRI